MWSSPIEIFPHLLGDERLKKSSNNIRPIGNDRFGQLPRRRRNVLRGPLDLLHRGNKLRVVPQQRRQTIVRLVIIQLREVTRGVGRRGLLRQTAAPAFPAQHPVPSPERAEDFAGGGGWGFLGPFAEVEYPGEPTAVSEEVSEGEGVELQVSAADLGGASRSGIVVGWELRPGLLSRLAMRVVLGWSLGKDGSHVVGYWGGGCGGRSV